MRKLARAILTIVLTIPMWGQVKEAATFGVVAIKPTGGSTARTAMFPTPGTLNISNYTLKRLILEAYRIKNYQLTDRHGWTPSITT